MNDPDADSRDAAYLACQLQTNSVIIQQKAKMEHALKTMHQHFLEVTEGVEMPTSVFIPVPRIDMSPSHPRTGRSTPPPAMPEEPLRTAELQN